MKLPVTFVLVALALGASATAFGDGDHKPKYGGALTVVKDVEYELVAKPDAISIFVDDHGKKVSTKGGSGKLTLLTGSEKTEVVLTPVGENGLEYRGSTKLGPGTKAVATITLAGKPAISARYEIK
jgi:uncharacterized Ntn-hydrolase superfamily protein